MKTPGARPTCKHGNPVGGMYPCKDCHKEDLSIREKVKPLVDEFWDNRGSRDLTHLMRRAYMMGMKHSDN